jgi:hypothetical protein
MEILILCVFCVTCGVVLGWTARAAFSYRDRDRSTWGGTDDERRE